MLIVSLTMARTLFGWRFGVISAADGGPVALQFTNGGLRLFKDRRRQGRVVGLAEHALAGAETVVEELHDALGGGFATGHAGLAHVLVDDHERLRGDGVGRG